MGHRGDEMRLVADAIVTMDAAHRVLRPGALDVVDGRIAWVGDPGSAPRSELPTKRMGGLLMPGLVNTHAHTPMTLLRSAGDGLALAPWLEEVIWPRESRLEDEDVYWGMIVGAEELLLGGVTTSCEMYLHNPPLVAAVRDAGVRCVVTPVIFDLPGRGEAGHWTRFLDDAVELFDEVSGRDPLVTVGLGPHSVYALPREGLIATGRAARERNALIQIHVAETRDERDRVHELHGCSAPELLAELGLFDGPVLAAHSVWLSDADLDLYQRHDVAVAHCPGSNGKLGSGIARIAEMSARGIRIGLGTDGPASNDDLEVWEELRLAALFARASAADPQVIPTRHALELATSGGAAALGLDVGVLEVDRPADVIRLNLDDARFTPALDDDQLIAHLAWGASSRLVTDVWVAGRQVVDVGACTTIDGSIARRELVARARRLADAS
jgi:5-methylthioadenosine/S-adenosylhomocysteine deaminase